MLPPNSTEILKKLTPKDLKKLGEFISSPYFNSKESLCLLYDEIAKRYPDFRSKEFEYQNIYKKIYGNSKYKQQTIKNLYSEFGNLLKKFIACERLFSREVDLNITVMEGMFDKKCYTQAEKISQLTRKQKSFISLPEEDYAIYMYKILHYDYELMLHTNQIDLDKFHKVYNLINDKLIEFFFNTFYFYLKEDFILTKAHNTKTGTSSMTKKFIESFDAEKFFNNDNTPVALRIRYLAYKYLNGITIEQYKELEDLIINNLNSLSLPFKITTWASLINLILLHLIPKDKKYYRNAFEINDYFLKQNLYPNDYLEIGLTLFRNSFGIALILNEYDWAEKYVNTYSQYLIEEAKENELNYSLGRLMFQQKKYEKSLEYLSNVKYQQVEEKMNVRFYYMMNYIELKSYASAIAMLNSIRQFYTESKELPEMFAVLTENSLKFFREIIKAEENNKKLDYSVYKEAQGAGRYYQKQYILEKMKGLI